MGKVSRVAADLKALRERAGLSVRAMARALDMGTTSYQHYEDRYKREYLPIEIVVKLKKSLVSRGIPEKEIDKLAGIFGGDVTVDYNPIKYVPVISWAQASMTGQDDDLGKTQADDYEPIATTRETVIALRVEDEAMNLVAGVGTIIFVDYADRDLIDDKLYLIRHQERALFRRYRAEPTPRYEPLSSTASFETVFPGPLTAVIGRVVAAQRWL